MRASRMSGVEACPDSFRARRALGGMGAISGPPCQLISGADDEPVLAAERARGVAAHEAGRPLEDGCGALHRAGSQAERRRGATRADRTWPVVPDERLDAGAVRGVAVGRCMRHVADDSEAKRVRLSGEYPRATLGGFPAPPPTPLCARPASDGAGTILAAWPRARQPCASVGRETA